MDFPLRCQISTVGRLSEWFPVKKDNGVNVVTHCHQCVIDIVAQMKCIIGRCH